MVDAMKLEVDNDEIYNDELVDEYVEDETGKVVKLVNQNGNISFCK